MKYRNKPVVIEAFKWTADHTQTEYPSWICDAIRLGKVSFNMGRDFKPDEMLINTLKGLMRADIGDYIIQGIKGEIYPIKEDIFLMTYEAVNDEHYREGKMKNEPAFPVANSYKPHNQCEDETKQTGITTRDYFAAKAMQGMCAYHGTYGMNNGRGDVAKRAYEIADAMLEARDKTTS